MKEPSVALSILIVSWNTSELLCECLQSVYIFLDSSIYFEIIVVDNASSDDSVESVRNRFPQVTLIVNEENVGFAKAVNQAALVSTGRFLLLLNSDTRCLDDSLQELVRIMEADSTIGVIGGKMISVGDIRGPSFFCFPSILHLVKSNSLDLIYSPGLGARQGKKRKDLHGKNDQRIFEVDWVCGAYLLARRSLMEDDKLLDRRIFMYFEDTLLCKKAWDLGYRVVSVDGAEIFHVGGASVKKASAVNPVYSYKSSRIYVKEMYGESSVWLYERVLRLVWHLLISFLFIPGLFGFGEVARQKREILRKLLAIPLLA